MPKKEYSRTQRVGELIQRELANILQREIHPTGLGMLTISRVEVAADLKLAKVYVTLLGGSWSILQILQYLEERSGFLRHQLSQRLTLRTTPRLQFAYDTSIEAGLQLLALIDSVRNRE